MNVCPLPCGAYYANIGYSEALYSITFCDDGTFETVEQGEYPTPTRIKSGAFRRLSGRSNRIELHYTAQNKCDDRDETEISETVLVEFYLQRKPTIHVSMYASEKPSTTRTVLLFDRTPLPLDAAQFPLCYRFTVCPIVYYGFEDLSSKQAVATSNDNDDNNDDDDDDSNEFYDDLT